MGKNKTTKVRKQWTNTYQIIKMGDEINRDDIKPSSVYSVLMFRKGEKSLEYHWGIIITDKEGCIARNYNINASDAWDSNHVKEKNGWRYFNADVMSETFARTYAKVVVLLHKLEKTEQELKAVKYENEHKSLWDRIMGR